LIDTVEHVGDCYVWTAAVSVSI